MLLPTYGNPPPPTSSPPPPSPSSSPPPYTAAPPPPTYPPCVFPLRFGTLFSFGQVSGTELLDTDARVEQYTEAYMRLMNEEFGEPLRDGICRSLILPSHEVPSSLSPELLPSRPSLSSAMLLPTLVFSLCLAGQGSVYLIDVQRTEVISEVQSNVNYTSNAALTLARLEFKTAVTSEALEGAQAKESMISDPSWATTVVCQP